MLDQQQIAKMLPHAGDMCLLSKVLTWDAEQLTGLAVDLNFKNNPLLCDAELFSITGVEYAAQAVAVHAGLASGQTSGEGYLVQIKNINIHKPKLSSEPIKVAVYKQALQPYSMIYDFKISESAELIIEGTLMIALKTQGELP